MSLLPRIELLLASNQERGWAVGTPFSFFKYAGTREKAEDGAEHIEEIGGRPLRPWLDLIDDGKGKCFARGLT